MLFCFWLFQQRTLKIKQNPSVVLPKSVGFHIILVQSKITLASWNIRLFKKLPKQYNVTYNVCEMHR